MLATLLAVLFAAQPDPGPFDGRYALEAAPEQCARRLDEEDGPAVFSRGRYDQYEIHCEWGRLHAIEGGAWTAKGFCSAEGNTTPGPFRFRLARGRLVMHAPSGTTTTFQRCPGRRG